MLGLPLVPATEVADHEAVFLSVHALKDSDLVAKLIRMMASGRKLLITDGLRDLLDGEVDLSAENVQILPVQGDPRSLPEMAPTALQEIRTAMLAPLRIRFEAPSRVALYLMDDDLVVIENFN